MISKTLEQLSSKELAEIHLDVDSRGTRLADGWIQSGMHHLVHEIRATQTRRSTMHFSPLYCAFALLDQVGAVYYDKNMTSYGNQSASGIKKALYYFGGMPCNNDEVKALYGLRNSLMHDGSLLYRGRFNSKSFTWKGPYHRFIVNPNLATPVKLPVIPWNGDLDCLQHFEDTEVNIKEICDLALKCVAQAKTLLDAGSLGAIIHEGKQEFYYRYLHHKLL